MSEVVFCGMEIQVAFDGLRSYLSYRCLDQVEIGDRVMILDGVRTNIVGHVVALERGKARGSLCLCRRAAPDEEGYTGSQDQLVKSRLRNYRR